MTQHEYLTKDFIVFPLFFGRNRLPCITLCVSDQCKTLWAPCYIASQPYVWIKKRKLHDISYQKSERSLVEIIWDFPSVHLSKMQIQWHTWCFSWTECFFRSLFTEATTSNLLAGWDDRQIVKQPAFIDGSTEISVLLALPYVVMDVKGCTAMWLGVHLSLPLCCMHPHTHARPHAHMITHRQNQKIFLTMALTWRLSFLSLPSVSPLILSWGWVIPRSSRRNHAAASYI